MLSSTKTRGELLAFIIIGIGHLVVLTGAVDPERWVQFGTLSYGYDIRGSFTAENHHGCCDLCNKYDKVKCLAYIWNSRTKECLLKNGIGPTKPDNYSSYTGYPHVYGLRDGIPLTPPAPGRYWLQLHVTDLENNFLTPPEPEHGVFEIEACRERCHSTAGCAAYVWRSKQLECWLKKGIGKIEQVQHSDINYQFPTIYALPDNSLDRAAASTLQESNQRYSSVFSLHIGPAHATGIYGAGAVYYTYSNSCPPGWEGPSPNQKCYRVTSGVGLLVTGDAICGQTAGAQLASIESQDEWNFIKSKEKLRHADKIITSGRSDANHNWSWADGTPFSFKNFEMTGKESPNPKLQNVYLYIDPGYAPESDKPKFYASVSEEHPLLCELSVFVPHHF